MLAGALTLAGCGFPNTVLDEGRVREATEAHFGSPLAPIDVGPVVISGDHAIADWTQGDFGGRALFERGAYGWGLLLCSGDSIRRADNLARAGVPDFNARWIADQLAKAESQLPPARLARMKRFTGTAADHEAYLKTLGDQ
nr:copper uptake system-associated protein [Sphingomonas panni]